MLVSGPMGTRVISPGAVITVSTMNEAASPSTVEVTGGSRKVLPMPSSPWTNATGPRYGIASGASAPRATGMSARPAISSSLRALRVVTSVWALPKMVVRPTTHSSGDSRA
ncbi:MAG: hypothetical protein V9E89_01240 [Ilumatobacteraceae bacterium]